MPTTVEEKQRKAAYMRQYRAEHLEEMRAIERRNYPRYKERRAVYIKGYNAVHKEEKKAAARQWYLDHVAETKQAARIWKLNHPNEVRKSRVKSNLIHAQEKREYDRAYDDLHPEMKRKRAAKRRAIVREAEGQFTTQEFRSLCEAHQEKCVYCGVETKLGPDHITPLIKGGSNYISNIFPACNHCNCRKHTSTFDEFLVSLGDEIAKEVQDRIYEAQIHAS